MSKRVVSRSSYVDPSKIGTSSPSTPAVKTEDATTVRYRTSHGPQTPSAPPEEPSSSERSSSPQRHYPTPKVDEDRPVAPRAQDDKPCRNLFIAVCIVLIAIAVYLDSEPREATLVKADWTFIGLVQAYEPVEERSWQPPPAGAVLISEKPHFYQWRTVVDRIDVICTDKPVVHQILSHTTRECKEELSYTEPDKQVYSHTDRIDYDDGSFDVEDVFIKVPGKAVYEERCVDTPVYQNFIQYQPSCENVPITHKEEDIRPYYTYETMRWVNKRPVEVASYEGIEPQTLLKENERYDRTGWTYTLYFEKPTKQVIVTKAKYLEYKDKIGEVVEIPPHKSWFS